MKYYDQKEIISANIKFYRKKKGWSQERLAHEIGMHRTYIGAVEQLKTNPSIDSLSRIAEGLGVTPLMLMVHPNERQSLEQLASIFQYSITKLED